MKNLLFILLCTCLFFTVITSNMNKKNLKSGDEVFVSYAGEITRGTVIENNKEKKLIKVHLEHLYPEWLTYGAIK